MHRLLLAVIALVVCIAMTGPFRGIVGVRAAIAVTHDARRSNDSQRHADVAPSERADLEAIESEADDDDDEVLGGLSDEPHFVVPGASRRSSGRPPSGEVANDTSRWAARTTLARGPPA